MATALVAGATMTLLFVACRTAQPPAERSDVAPSTSAVARPSGASDASAAECLPVAACLMFVSCAVAEPLGADRYRIISYPHHPHKNGSTMVADEVRFRLPDAGTGSARALKYDDVPCTPVPPEQIPLTYACTSVAGRCEVR